MSKHSGDSGEENLPSNRQKHWAELDLMVANDGKQLLLREVTDKLVTKN